MTIDFATFGGRIDQARSLNVAQGSGGQTWNFGVKPITPAVQTVLDNTPTMYDRFPALEKKWDGVSTINAIDAVKKAGVDPDSLIQEQPRGTCGGRSGSLTSDLLCCIAIASGVRQKFYRASHAMLYWLARRMYNMANGNPNDPDEDGVASGSIPEVMARYGLNTRDEAGDLNAYGQGSDNLACLWGAGRIDPATAAKLEGLAVDNVVTAQVRIRSAQEGADAIAAGGILLGSDSQGFTTTRDAAGFCRPQGQWHHYQVRGGVFNDRGRKGFDYYQSWGRGNPGGPILPGRTSNVFGVDWDVQDHVIRNGHWSAIFSIPAFELEQGGRPLSWVF